eukprot:NODE_176_length_14102_cov_0.889595.p12 type:complete len:138 gc:universal NODE_176_length_14102_cov_0.889595:9831-9418(-)
MCLTKLIESKYGSQIVPALCYMLMVPEGEQDRIVMLSNCFRLNLSDICYALCLAKRLENKSTRHLCDLFLGGIMILQDFRSIPIPKRYVNNVAQSNCIDIKNLHLEMVEQLESVFVSRQEVSAMIRIALDIDQINSY